MILMELQKPSSAKAGQAKERDVDGDTKLDPISS
jgi:hypothetical protein